MDSNFFESTGVSSLQTGIITSCPQALKDYYGLDSDYVVTFYWGDNGLDEARVNTVVSPMKLRSLRIDVNSSPNYNIEILDNLYLDTVSIVSLSDCDIVNVNLCNFENCIGEVICVAYENGRYLDMQKKTISEHSSFTFCKGATDYKAFVWDSLSGMKPLMAGVVLAAPTPTPEAFTSADVVQRLDTLINYQNSIYCWIAFALTIGIGGWIIYQILRPLIYFIKS